MPDLEELVVIGDVYEHTESKTLFKIIDTATCGKTGEIMLIYQSLDSSELWVRCVSDFFAKNMYGEVRFKLKEER